MVYYRNLKLLEIRGKIFPVSWGYEILGEGGLGGNHCFLKGYIV